MPTINGERLPYGQDYLVPETSPGAWGARMIVDQRGHVDFVPDRQGAAGDSDRVFDALDERLPLPVLREKISNLLRSGEMQTRVAADLRLYDDDVVEVHANTNASAGYCYVTAWLKP